MSNIRHPYVTLHTKGDVEVSYIRKADTIEVYFEKAVDTKDRCFNELILDIDRTLISNIGFSTEEVDYFIEFVKSNAGLIKALEASYSKPTYEINDTGYEYQVRMHKEIPGLYRVKVKSVGGREYICDIFKQLRLSGYPVAKYTRYDHDYGIPLSTFIDTGLKMIVIDDYDGYGNKTDKEILQLSKQCAVLLIGEKQSEIENEISDIGIKIRTGYLGIGE